MWTLSDTRTVGVVGAGRMGSGIAQVAATHGYEVVVRDVDRERVESGLDTIERNLDRMVATDRLSREAADLTGKRVTGTIDMGALAPADVVVEAVDEDLERKRDVFVTLQEAVDDGAVLATNTSTLSSTSIASATDRPERVVGIHFMNPVPVMDGVEVVVGERTAPGTAAFAHEFAEALGKETWATATGRGS